MEALSFSIPVTFIILPFFAKFVDKWLFLLLISKLQESKTVYALVYPFILSIQHMLGTL